MKRYRFAESFSLNEGLLTRLPRGSLSEIQIGNHAIGLGSKTSWGKHQENPWIQVQVKISMISLNCGIEMTERPANKAIRIFPKH